MNMWAKDFVSDYIHENCSELAYEEPDMRRLLGGVRMSVIAGFITSELLNLERTRDNEAAYIDSMHRIALYTRNLYAYSLAARASDRGIVPLVYDEDADAFRRATCSLCPADPDSPMLTGHCRACDMAEHADPGAWADALADEVGL